MKAPALRTRSRNTFDGEVEQALKEALTWPATDGESRERRLKALAISVKWCAVKSKIVTTEHGSGFVDDDDEELTSGI